MDKTAEKANKLHTEVQKTKGLVLEKVVEIGILLEQKKVENPGRFYAWVRENLTFSTDQASRYIRLSNLKRTKYKKAKSAREIMRSESKPLTLERAIAEETKGQIQYIPIIEDRELTDKEMKMMRIEFYNFLEYVYDLGKRDKILPMEYKRKSFERICKIAKVKVDN